MSRDLFQPASRRKAFLKMGLFGLAGTGKTYTAGMMARGVVETMRAKGIDGADRPVFMFDTETGADWLARDFEGAGIDLRVASTRAFSDLIDAAQWLQDEASVVIIDSVSHFWAEFTDSYARKRNRDRLEFQDWGYLKKEWARFTSWFVNAPTHVILCGRQAYEYSNELNDRGKREIVRGNAKMKAEGELGYEPSLLVQMERESADGVTRRIATVLKDRSRALDGVELCDVKTGGPTWDSFAPHLDGLNLGGTHAGFDESRASDDFIEPDATAPGNERAVILDEIKGAMMVIAPSQSAADKRTRLDLLYETFGCRGWSAVEATPIQDLRRGGAKLDAMAEELQERLAPSESKAPR